MSEDNAPAPEGNSNIVHVPTSDDSPLSPLEAARSLADYRFKRDKEQAEAPKPAAEPQPEPSQEASAAPAEEATGEQPTETTTEPAEEPTIEAPRSWSKEWKEEFKSYPREVQEKISAREQDRETTLRRGQNELAEQRKAIEAERQQVEQARTQYEQALPALLQTLHQQQQGEFQDIKTMADVEKLAREDWPRYALWDAQQKKIAAVSQELKTAEQRQVTEKQSKWNAFAQKEDAAFLERAPDLADSAKASKAAESSFAMLKDLGFSEQELARYWYGQENPPMRDHRIQLIIRDAARYRDAQKAVPAKVAKPVPPVQRPGTAPAKGADADLRARNLEKQLEKTGDIKDAVAFLNARRARG